MEVHCCPDREFNVLSYALFCAYNIPEKYMLELPFDNRAETVDSSNCREYQSVPEGPRLFISLLPF